MSATCTRNRKVGKAGYWRSKQYNSIRLRKKKNRYSTSVIDKSRPWRMSSEEPDPNRGRRTSEIHERDVFLELLSQVQDNRYENQRYTLKADSTTDDSNPDENSRDDIIPVNGSIPNGRTSARSPVPTIEISPTNEMNGDIPDGRLNGSISSGSGLGEEAGRGSLSSPPLPGTSAPSTPSRRSMEALRNVLVLVNEGPYPLLIEPPDGGFWIQNGEYDEALGEDGVWRAPEISTEHYSIQVDKTALVYGRNFVRQEHHNYIGRDNKVGPVLLSMMFDEDYQGTIVRTLLRTQKETVYKVFPQSQLPEHMEPEDYIRYVSKMNGEELNVDKAIRITYPKAAELIQKFDEHPVARTHKFGVIYQQFGQTSEEEIFGNMDHPPAFDEFLDMLGDKVCLRGFSGYRGGLDVCNDQTGETSTYTEYKDRQIMFHISTLLPLDVTDTQHVQRKRHIGNDIVLIVFQDANTPFCPNTIRSHFVHSYIVVQVEHPNTDHTVYKVAVAAKDHVPDFGPPLPDPAVFQKGPEFRDWLLTKVLNAEFNCHQAPDFLRLATRTRHQLFLHLIEDIAQTMEDVDHPSLTKSLMMSLDPTVSGPSPRSQRRRRTLGGIFSSTKENLHLPSFKRKSISGSPKTFHKLSSTPVTVMIGSTPDLAITTDEGKNRGSPASVRSLKLTNCTSLDEDSLTIEKGGKKIKRRFTFKKEKEKEKEKKKPKRTISEGANVGIGISDFVGGWRRRKQSGTPMFDRGSSLKRDNSSEESSIASNLNWSIPYDLPGTVESPLRRKGRSSLENLAFSDSSDFRERCRSTPTILERNESAVSVSDVRISQEGPLTADVAVQVDKDGVFKFPSPSSPNVTLVTNARDSHSLPSTPSRLVSRRGMVHKLATTQEACEDYDQRSVQGTRTQDPERWKKLVLRHVTSSPILGSSHPVVHDTTSEYAEGRGNSYENGRLIFRAESTESLSAEVDSTYDSLLNSLQSLTMEVSRLREQNLHICRENVRFASQNRRLKLRWKEAKQQLVEAQEEVSKLQLKLRLYQPNFESD